MVEAEANPTAAAPPSPSPTAVPLPPLSTLTPEATVRLFYQLLGMQRYADLHRITTAGVLDALPDATALDDRTPAGTLRIDRAELIAQDPSGNRATVAVDVVEELSASRQQSRRYRGTWTLVRGPGGWLLEAADLHMEQES
jgi:hypothetical protein